MSDSIRNKMLHFQAEPPASAWDNIAKALDDATPVYAEKLYNYQQQPSADVWNKIASQLGSNEVSQPKVIPLKGFSKSLQYAAAAAIIAAIVFSVFYLSNTNHTTDIAQQPVASNKANSNNAANSDTQQSINKSDDSIIPAEKINKDFSEPLASAAPAAEQLTKRSIAKRSEAKTSIEIPLHALTAKVPDVLPQSKDLVDEEVAERYMIATKKEGSAVRLPKKAYSDFACANKALAANVSAPCKEKVESLQNKMAASITTDFANFLDLLKNLQEN